MLTDRNIVQDTLQLGEVDQQQGRHHLCSRHQGAHQLHQEQVRGARALHSPLQECCIILRKNLVTTKWRQILSKIISTLKKLFIWSPLTYGISSFLEWGIFDYTTWVRITLFMNDPLEQYFSTRVPRNPEVLLIPNCILWESSN